MQIIDYNAIEKNALFFKRLVGESKLCAVLKNNAYGHGLTHVARHIVGVVDCFAVGTIDEAEQLLPLHKDILILLPQNERNTVRAIKSNCILTVDSFFTLNLVDTVARSLNKTARVHIKIDSGMSRLGFQYADIGELLQLLCNSNLEVEGIFSHFYGDTEPECDAQFRKFELCFKEFEQRLGFSVVKHIANSGAALLSSKYHLDMVRVGLGLYGYGNDSLLPAKRVNADVISVKRAVAGSVVGYGAKYVCTSDTNIATLNVGYATGLSRTLIGSKVQIGNNLYPIVAICMAMTLVDVGDAEISVGEVATLLGQGVNIANDQVIIYELLCNLK
ncbi:MAG: alanine racemase [Clostridiales bacterium]|nr:alanine racemase [Clostridiales bacterium]